VKVYWAIFFHQECAPQSLERRTIKYLRGRCRDKTMSTLTGSTFVSITS